MKTRYWASLVGAVALFASAQASAGLINFENAPSKGLSDNDQVTNEYQTSDGVTFLTVPGVFLEATGDSSVPPPDTDPQGFLNNGTGQFDDPAAPGLGNWFLRSGADITSPRCTSATTCLDVIYSTPVTQASGQIWDIDGTQGQGTEQWLVTALMGGVPVFSVTSPLGTPPPVQPGSLDGLPWTFNLFGHGAFDEIQFNFIGTKTHGIGLAFDNFRTNSISAPEPAALGMFGLGALLIGLFAGLRRRMG